MQTIGILGAGQLARMLSLAAYPLGLRTICFDPNEDVCGADVTSVLRADYTASDALKKFAEQVDVITLENENIPVDTLTTLAHYRPVWPDAKAVAYAQDRLFEKHLFQTLDIPTPAFHTVENVSDLENTRIPFPAILKTRRFGYDGKGQYVLRTPDDIALAWAQLGKQALILESFVPFSTEVSFIAVRNAKKECRFYPLIENRHQAGILHISRAPFENEALRIQAQTYVQRLLDHLDYIGILTVEFFVCDGKLIANEMAPRVHNSGHWTIEGAVTSQFANHIRAITGLPLGNTEARGFSAMLNCIGAEPDMASILQLPNTYYHRYHKTPKPQRKLAHITINTKTPEERETLLHAILQTHSR